MYKRFQAESADDVTMRICKLCDDILLSEEGIEKPVEKYHEGEEEDDPRSDQSGVSLDRGEGH